MEAAITTPEALEEMIDGYLKVDAWVFDVETLPGREPRYKKDAPEGDPLTNIPFWISFATTGRADVIPMGHPPPAPPQLHRSDVFRALEPLFFSEQLKINHNIKFDLRSIAKMYKGKVPTGPYGDTVVLTHLLDENLTTVGGYNLGNLVNLYLGYSYPKLGELGVQNFSFEEAYEYSYRDAKMTWLLWRNRIRDLQQYPRLRHLFEIEMELLEVVIDMEQAGALVEMRGFERVDADLKKRLAQIKTRAFKHTGRRISLTNDAQKSAYLYDELGLECQVRTKKTGRPSVAESALRPLASKHPFVRDCLEFKSIQKLHSTFVLGLMNKVDDDDRIRASFKQSGTVTGRFSCQPNLQNIPIREKAEGKLIRTLFIAPPGCSLVVADYGAIELRVLAHYTQDRALLQAFREDLDMHSFTASRMYGIKMGEVDPELRALGKKCNFLLAYGGTYKILASAGEMSERQAKQQHKRFHEAYPGIDRWTEQTIAIAHRQGGVETLLGRRRRLPEIRSHNKWDRLRAERQAVNTVIQGGAADILKLAMCEIYSQTREPWSDWKMIMTVHDELIMEVHDSDVDDAVSLIRNCMEGITLGKQSILSVPLKADVHAVKRWSEAK